MTKQVIWTDQVIETFIRGAHLSPLEAEIVRTRADGWTRTKQSIQLHLSESAIDYHIKILKVKYDILSAQNPDLPPRRKSAKELYQG